MTYLFIFKHVSILSSVYAVNCHSVTNMAMTESYYCLRCDAVEFDRLLPILEKNLLPPIFSLCGGGGGRRVPPEYR